MGLKNLILTTIPVRYVFVFMGFWIVVNNYVMRCNMNVAIIAMVNSSAIQSKFNEAPECISNIELSNGTSNNKSQSEKDGSFVWDEQTQGIILSSFYWSNTFFEAPVGRLSERFSAKWVIGLGILFSSLLTLLTPLAAWNGIGYVIAIRLLIGIFESGWMSAILLLITRWGPVCEISRMVSFTQTGVPIGIILTYSISSYLLVHGFAGGWPSVFYTTGFCGFICFCFWVLLVYESPSTHPWILSTEKEYIEKNNNFGGERNTKISIPWREMIKSLPFWAIIVSGFSQLWGFTFLMTETPNYLKTILYFSYSKSSLLSAGPYMGLAISNFVSGIIFDKIIEKNMLSTKNTRRVANTIGLIVPAASFVFLTFAGCDKLLSYTILVIEVTLNGTIMSGFHANIADVAPTFAGTIAGIKYSLGGIAGIAAPDLVGYLTQGKPFRSQWAIVFYLSAGVLTFGAVFFYLFCEGEEVSWSRNATTKKKFEDIEISTKDSTKL